jgi:hypothetical protein
MPFAAIPGPLATRWVRRIVCRRTLSSRDDASLAAILTRSACRTLSGPLVPGGLIAGRRLPPCPRFIASQGLRFKEAGLTYGSRFPLSPCTFVSDDERKYIEVALDRQKNRLSAEKLSTTGAQALIASCVDGCITRWKDCPTSTRLENPGFFSPRSHEDTNSTTPAKTASRLRDFVVHILFSSMQMCVECAPARLA